MKEYRRYALLVALIVIAVFLLSPKSDVTVQGTLKDPLASAVNSTGAAVEELTVNGWGKLPMHELSDGEMEQLARQAIERLGYKRDQYSLSHQRSAHHRQVRAEALTSRSQTVAVVQVLYPSWEKKGPEVYMVVNVEVAKPEDNISELRSKVKKIINDNGGMARVNTCLVGWLDGKLEEEEKVSKLNIAFKTVNASVISTLSYPNMASYTGFTPLVSDTLQIGQDRVNINMAIRYSQYDNRTYVMVGSPVITQEY